MATWERRLWHGLGMTRRALETELSEALEQIESLRGLDESALSEALARIRGEARLGRLSNVKGAPGKARSNRAFALALLAVAAERSLFMRPHPPQLLAALAMHAGMLVEMPAGEGKTLAVALAAVLLAWRGRPCHLATANEYLASRNAELMRPLFARCGLEVVAVVQNMQPDQTTEAYRADVVYAAGKQLLADFLRDQLILGGVEDPLRRRLHGLSADAGGRRPVMRGLHAVIVDDAETVLYDDAATPVVISAPSDNPMMIEAVRCAHELVGHLQAGRDYRALERQRDIEFTVEGESRLEQHEHLLPPLWRARERRDDLVRQAIVVRDQLRPRRHYLVQQGRLSIIDDYIGRLLVRPGWMQGLYQAIEVKEGLKPTPPSRVLARMGVNPFFRRYPHLGGIGDAAYSARSETWRSLGRLSLRLRSSTAMEPYLCRPGIWPNHESKRAAMVQTLVQLHRHGLPALVCLRRVVDAEALAKQLGEQGLGCQYINPRQSSGMTEALNGMTRPGQISLTLNMDACGAGLPMMLDASEARMRTTKSRLKQGVAEDAAEIPELTHHAGLRVLQFETQDLARQDRRILALAGRPDQPGVARQYLALDDDLFRYHLPGWCGPLLALAARNTSGLSHGIAHLMFRYAQSRAENQARRLRRMQPRREAILNQQLAFTGDRDMDVGAQQYGKY